MRLFQRLTFWLESHWVTPAYSGWVLLGVALFFFGAATNTMAGWLYVISGVMMAMLSIGSILPQRSLQGLAVRRQPILPVSAGSALLVTLEVENETRRAKSLLQVRERVPSGLGRQPQQAIAAIAPADRYRWVYELPTERRGIYHWQLVQLRTAAPLGLFWCSREQQAKAKAIVYPQILPLSHCPIVDTLGDESGLQWQRDRSANAGNEGLTRALRPYRWGDATRLIHWRTSARYGELRVRELEKLTSSQDVLIGLDTAVAWTPEHFEQAVIVAASLYCYALNRGLSAQFWSAETDFVRDRTAVLTALAAITFKPSQVAVPLPERPLIWLSAQPQSALPAGSRQVWFPNQTAAHSSDEAASDRSRLRIDPHEDLMQQLQSSNFG
ncbi:MAG: DUF58 domain-containing protein [Leptolyngbya sp. SIO4C1]|nr:DUF58 domain-containing protein [Leptolyngbya sp. SIO4C1]